MSSCQIHSEVRVPGRVLAVQVRTALVSDDPV